MYYNPDTSVVYTGPVGGQSSSNSDGGFDNNYIMAIVVPTVLLALTIPASIAIIIILVTKKGGMHILDAQSGTQRTVCDLVKVSEQLITVWRGGGERGREALHVYGKAPN
ncbi:MAG: hypothetical protein KIY12_10070 [Thermoplasmata archaeon]|uniref:Uncharacterized protein n=1 Tax=Candidatus Sysuiplasma superficiale TaxID=2823368 RepID=A0A8J7YQN4_9ARCH|nr:hypothetical protein [Candidatus Sysuiplasma superficiale]